MAELHRGYRRLQQPWVARLGTAMTLGLDAGAIHVTLSPSGGNPIETAIVDGAMLLTAGAATWTWSRQIGAEKRDAVAVVARRARDAGRISDARIASWKQAGLLPASF